MGIEFRVTSINHKGFTGIAECDWKSEVLFGHVINKDAIITFRGKSVADTKQSFIDSVEAYIEFCEETGVEP